MMWNVMAADDEAYIREALQKLISWEKMGCSLKYVAEDGKKPVSYTHLTLPTKLEV